MPRPLVVAHRGSSGELPEHTLAAYERAVAQGVDGLECDVRLTADGELVCLHDRTLERTLGHAGAVAGSTLAELRALDWGAWRHPDPTTPRTPGDDRLMTLRELVELVLDAGRPLGLLVETKHPTRWGGRVEHAVAALLRDHGLTHPATPERPWARMMSFSTAAVRRMAGALPTLPTVQLVGAGPPLPTALLPAALAAATWLPGTVALGLDVALVRAHPEAVAAQRAAGRDVFVWTVDEPADLELCCRLGVTAIITNWPETALDVAGRTG